MSEINNEIWQPEELVLGPGAVKGFLILGALQKLLDYYKNVKYWTGCSIGSAIALLLVSGYTIEEIIEDCLAFDVLEDLNHITLQNILEKAGIISNQNMEETMSMRIQQKFGFIPTLKQLYLATGLIYTSVTYNNTKMRTEYLNKDTEPDILCVEAAMMSMAMPVAIQPRIYKGCEYVDGAVGDPYPILYHDNGKRNILGIYISSDHNTCKNNNIKTAILHKAYEAVQALIKSLRDKHIEWASDKVKHLGLTTDIKDSIGITINRAAREAMIKSGYNNAEVFLAQISHPNKYTILLSEDEEIAIVENDIMLDESSSEDEEILTIVNKD